MNTWSVLLNVTFLLEHVAKKISTALSRECKLLVVCGPSGSGKSTLLQRLFREDPMTFGFCVSHTSRNARLGEVDGKHYHFTTAEKIQEGIKRGYFLETATFSGHYYGTSLEAVRNVCESGKVCVLDIETEGVKQMKQKDLDLMLVFIKPPSLWELEKRLRLRGTENENSLKQRLCNAIKEIEYGETEGNFDIVIENHNLDKSYKILKSFVKSQLITKCRISLGGNAGKVNEFKYST